MKTWQVSDVMSTAVAAVTPDATYREIVDVITAGRISGVPVVDADQRVVGVVSEADLLHKVELVGEPVEWRLFESRNRRTARVKADAAVAEHLMSSPAVTTRAQVSVTAAARQMARERVKRLPVVDDSGRLVGIVTRGDLLRVHLRPDVDIRRDVVEEVLRKILAIHEGMVRVEVRDGVVTMAGQLDRRSSVEVAGRLAAQVSGVVEVVNHLGYEVDDSPYVGRGEWPAHPTAVA